MMKNNDMIDRYVHAVTKNLSPKLAKDVSDELNSIISDMLDERCGDIMPTDKDILVVLTEIGTPNELADKYKGKEAGCLIGEPYYSKYILVLKIVVACMTFGVTLSNILLFLLEPPHSFYTPMFQWFGMIISGFMYAFTFITLFFAVFYHKGIEIKTPNDTIENLPPVPKRTDRISKWECLVSISFSVVFAIIFLMAPQIFGYFHPASGEFIPLLNAEVIRSTWYIIVAFAVAGIIRESVKLIDGRYSLRVMVATIATDLFSAVLAIVFLANYKVVNTGFFGAIADISGEAGDFVWNIFYNFQYFFLGIMLFALVLDMGSTVVKAIMAKGYGFDTK